MSGLMTCIELDRRLRYPSGRSRRLARKNLIPHIRLPNGEIRFSPEAIHRWLTSRTFSGEATAS